MLNNGFLPLTEYSSKYKVSISTLRRRIKTEDIRFLFEEGKYLIADEPLSTHQRVHRPSLNQSETALVGAQVVAPKETEFVDSMTLMNNKDDASILASANRLLNELKKAYSQILQEKEEQILNLKEEVSDLKTLVRVLESENERLKSRYLG